MNTHQLMLIYYDKKVNPTYIAVPTLLLEVKSIWSLSRDRGNRPKTTTNSSYGTFPDVCFRGGSNI